MSLDHCVALILTPLAFWVLLNGIDDLIVDVAGLVAFFRRRDPTEEELDAAPPIRMAVFVALWREHKVIRRMLENNASRLRYPAVDFFVGAYPNDALTLAAIRETMKEFPNVHLAICPHDGPTSKADCLNWIYQRMLLYEEEHGARFGMILTHDAEDMMDSDALRWINYYAQTYDMVQIPVLALPTPLREISHGVYCDEFAEFEYKDMPARELLGGFIPSNGVGTGFSRRALEKLAEAHSNRIFEPGCLTEDYENGWRIHQLGMKQKFIPLRFIDGRPIATREYFPRRFAAAVRQRSRWITGITLQSWELHSTRDTLGQLYWVWRDRKGLVANLLTPMMNVLFAAGASTWGMARAEHRAWLLGHEIARLSVVFAAGMALQAMHTCARAVCSGSIYGPRFALGVPVRVIAANWINFFATVKAIQGYVSAKLLGQPLRWVKTEHAYPNRAALMPQRKRLREILTGSGWIAPKAMEAALASRPEGRRLGEHLLKLGLISEEDLYTALSLQNDMPLGRPESISIPVTRALPKAVAQKWRVLPFRIAAGELHLAGPELPDEDMQRDIRQFSSLEIRFRLVTPTEFEELVTEYLN